MTREREAVGILFVHHAGSGLKLMLCHSKKVDSKFLCSPCNAVSARLAGEPLGRNMRDSRWRGSQSASRLNRSQFTVRSSRFAVEGGRQGENSAR